MRFGNYIIFERATRAGHPREARLQEPSISGSTGVQLSGALAVPDTTPWWRAVHQAIDEADAEAIDGARGNVNTDDHLCRISVAMSVGVRSVAVKLLEKRAAAIKMKTTAEIAEHAERTRV